MIAEKDVFCSDEAAAILSGRLFQSLGPAVCGGDAALCQLGIERVQACTH